LAAFVAGIGIVSSTVATADAATVTKSSGGHSFTSTGGHTSSGSVHSSDWWWN
jgi:hypothetical protein